MKKNKTAFKLFLLTFLYIIFNLSLLKAMVTYGVDAKFNATGNYIATVKFNLTPPLTFQSVIQIYRFDKTSGVAYPITSTTINDFYATCIDWNCGGTWTFVAVGGINLLDSLGYVQVYTLNEFTPSLIYDASSPGFDGAVRTLKWHPTNPFIFAIGKEDSQNTDPAADHENLKTCLFVMAPPAVNVIGQLNVFPLVRAVTPAEWGGNVYTLDWVIDDTLFLEGLGLKDYVVAGGSLKINSLDPKNVGAIRFVKCFLDFSFYMASPILNVGFNSTSSAANYFNFGPIVTALSVHPQNNLIAAGLAMGSDVALTDNTLPILEYAKDFSPIIRRPLPDDVGLGGYVLTYAPLLQDNVSVGTDVRQTSFSPGGDYVAYAASNKIQVYSFNKDLRKLSNLIYEDDTNAVAVDWSHDGRYWLYYTVGDDLFTFWSYYKFKNSGMIRLDGTYDAYFTENHIIFQDGDNAVGEVLMKGGFTIVDNAGVKLTINTPVFGPIDFRPTSTLDLGSDLILDSKVTFSNVGKIWGRGHTIFMTGDLTLPANSTLEFTNHATLDGQGHTLIIEPHTQILIDGGVTVTFKNMIIKNKINGTSEPPIKCIDWYSKACFDNITFSLNNDFLFLNGQMFVHNDVIFTGTSKFSYRSVLPSFVAQHSNLVFDSNTTFEYYPSTPDNYLIQMINKTSSVLLDGSTLQTTLTGIRLIKGSLYFDNKVTLSSKNNTTFVTLTQKDTKSLNSVNTVDWSHNGRYLAAGTNLKVFVYEREGSILTEKINKSFGSVVDEVNWSPDGRFLAVGGAFNPTTGLVFVYEWNGSTLTNKDSRTFTPVPSMPPHVFSVDWNPNGKFLAIAGYNGGGNDLVIYEWNGSTLTQRDSDGFATAAFSVKWNPNGKHLAVGGQNGTKDLIIYEWNGSTLTEQYTVDFADGANTVSWNPDGKFLAVAIFNNENHFINIYEWSGATLTQKDSVPLGVNVAYNIAWSPDGKYITVASQLTLELIIYEWDGSTLTQIYNKDFGQTAYWADWSPDGNLLAVGGFNNPTDLIVYGITYAFDASPQGFLNSIIFGDGNPENDLDINIDPGASINLKCGKIAYLNSN